MTLALAILLKYMHKKFEINQTKIKGGCQSGGKVVPHDSKSELRHSYSMLYVAWKFVWLSRFQHDNVRACLHFGHGNHMASLLS